MNLFTLWLMWLSKMSSFWGSGMQWQFGDLEGSKLTPSGSETTPPSPETTPARHADTSRQQEPAAPPEVPPPAPPMVAQLQQEKTQPDDEIAQSGDAIPSLPQEASPPQSPPEQQDKAPTLWPIEPAQPLSAQVTQEATKLQDPDLSPPEAAAPPHPVVSASQEAVTKPPKPIAPSPAPAVPAEPSSVQEVSRSEPVVPTEQASAAPAPADIAPPQEIAPTLEETAPSLPPQPLQDDKPALGQETPAPQDERPAPEERASPPEAVAQTHQEEAIAPEQGTPAPQEPIPEPEERTSPPEAVAQNHQEEAIAPEQETPAPQEPTPEPEERASPPEAVAPPLEDTRPAAQETATNPQAIVSSEQQAFTRDETGEGSMTTWRKRPMIYEIPTWVWLNEMRLKHGFGITLGTIPAAEWDALAALDIDAVWLMGVWERSPAGIAVSNANIEQQDEFRRLLPDYKLADNVGSAYCVRDYVVAEHLGGPEALAQARAALNARGLRLILDFVPNHVAIDHPWAALHPDYFVRGTGEDLVRAPAEFVEVKGHILANGRDPYFAPWRDVLQLNAYHTQLRAAVIETVTSIAAQCDGMRCDMAMLLLNDIFHRTWGDRAGEQPATEYWQEVIPAVKAKYPNTLFIAEVYWDLEYEMMQKGFDYCYDKRLYDRLVSDNAESIRAHLTAGLDYQDRLLRFIENHDEPRAAATFYNAKERAAAVVMATTPGAKLVYDGQIEGRQVKLPVFLARRRSEAPNSELETFYRSLLTAVHADLFHDGEWTLCDRSGWPDNSSFHDIVAWTWRYQDHRTLIVVNLSDHRSQAMVHLPWDDLSGQTWRLVETLAWECYVRDGGDLASSGLFVDLDAWGFHFLKFE